MLAGPNGAGKTSLFNDVIGPATNLPFVNADLLAAQRWPGDEEAHGHDAATAAADQRARLMQRRASFATETVFSHPSKVKLVRDAITAGYLVTLHVVIVPEDLTVARVQSRVEQHGHTVPEDKIRARYQRLWKHVAKAITLAHHAIVYDNSRAATPFRSVATFRNGTPTSEPHWPAWAATELVALTT